LKEKKSWGSWPKFFFSFFMSIFLIFLVAEERGKDLVGQKFSLVRGLGLGLGVGF
jgi:hypothetical protein